MRRNSDFWIHLSTYCLLMWAWAWLGTTPAWAQSEAESSQNVVRITEPQGKRSWDVSKGAETNFKLKNGKDVYGHVEQVQDSAFVISGRAYPLQEIQQLRVKDAKHYQAGWIMMGIAGAFWLIYSVAAYFFWFSFFGAIQIYSAIIAALFIMGAGLVLGVLFTILGGVTLAVATVRYVRAKGWNMRVVKRPASTPQDTVQRVD
jgi:hypothetical protein